ncbi:polysaccharide deacetylase family protein [Actinomadura sp. CNU-125]|uniref:polysaccharide deacetylase family protein n=1 Tax=Actinomadura sp. CNU-125 TaxID=1904961 RepID=UPI000ADE88BC|nr:polysaccharide deacetylase family protein [Actinomadura sp. CNU-125]
MRKRNVAIFAAGLLLLAGCGGAERPRAEQAGRNAALRDGSAPKTSRSARPAPREIDCAKVRCVALTFDDGPGPHTPELLDTLRRAGARATFFVQGLHVPEHPAVVRRMVAEGHEIGNHTWNHPNLTTLSPGEIRSQIERTQRAVKDAAGVVPAMMRPPYRGINEQVIETVGMPVILWSVDPQDWRRDDVARNVKIGLRDSGRGDIVLYHDVHATTVQAMPKIVTGLQKQGFTLVTVSELFGGRRLKAGEVYTEREIESTPVTAQPPPSGSPAGPQVTPGR